MKVVTSRLLEEQIAAVVVLGRGKENDAMWHVPQALMVNINRNRLLILLLLLLLNEVGSARMGETDLHPISQRTPSPQYQHIEIKKRKEKEQKTKNL